LSYEIYSFRDLAKQVFKCNGGNLLASIKTATMSYEAIAKCVEAEGAENIEQFNKDNNGCITVLPHMGNWEIGARLNEIYFPNSLSGAMYRPLNNPHMDELVKSRRQSSNTILFSRSDGMTAPLQHIRKGGNLGILADQRVQKGGIVTPFFSRLTPFAPLPEIYKKRTKCGLMSIAIITTGPGKWKVIFKEEATKDTKVNTADIAKIIERNMLLSQKDCFWMQDRWKHQRAPLSLKGKFPIQRTQSSNVESRTFPIAIYLPKILSEHIPALTSLAAHRPDIHLSILTNKKTSTDIPNSSIIISSPSNLLSDFISAFSERYIDLLFIPKNVDLILPSHILTKVIRINPNNLMDSLVSAGLPDQPYA